MKTPRWIQLTSEVLSVCSTVYHQADQMVHASMLAHSMEVNYCYALKKVKNIYVKESYI